MMGSRGGRDCGSWILEGSKASLTDCNSIFTGIFIGRTDAGAEAPILWPPDGNSQLIGKDPDAVKDWGQEEKRVTEDEMVGWHHWLNGHEFEQTPGDSEGQGSLACCSPWGCKESDMTEQLENNNNIRRYLNCLQVTKTRNYAARCLTGGRAAEGKRKVSSKEDARWQQGNSDKTCSLC